jgi:hypothetical protein
MRARFLLPLLETEIVEEFRGVKLHDPASLAGTHFSEFWKFGKQSPITVGG